MSLHSSLMALISGKPNMASGEHRSLPCSYLPSWAVPSELMQESRSGITRHCTLNLNMACLPYSLLKWLCSSTLPTFGSYAYRQECHIGSSLQIVAASCFHQNVGILGESNFFMIHKQDSLPR